MSDNFIQIEQHLTGFREKMKQLNFVEDMGYYTRDFTRIYVENGEFFIGHTISKNKLKFEYEHLNEYIKYFDRI